MKKLIFLPKNFTKKIENYPNSEVKIFVYFCLNSWRLLRLYFWKKKSFIFTETLEILQKQHFFFQNSSKIKKVS